MVYQKFERGGRWKDPAIVIEVDAKRRDVAIQGCEATEPWSMRAV